MSRPAGSVSPWQSPRAEAMGGRLTVTDEEMLCDSWLAQRAWILAREAIRKLPSERSGGES
ncbi:MAG TPA: hypothetical protein VGI39_16845 [Polyangiaceae bacterium]